MRKRILVVEDQPDNGQIIRDMLAGNDYEITEAEDSQQALAAVSKERPDLILMGIQLPTMSNFKKLVASPEPAPLIYPQSSRTEQELKMSPSLSESRESRLK